MFAGCSSLSLIVVTLCALSPLTVANAADNVALVLVNGAGLSAEAQREVRAALEEAVTASGRAPLDTSALTAGIFEAGMLVPEFDRAPPEGWPKPLLATWEEGNAACREQLGQPGGSPKRRLVLAAAAVECQRILSEALYGRLLRHLGPAQVLEVTVRPSRGGPDAPLRLTGRFFAPAADGAKVAEAESARASLPQKAGTLAKRLLEGGGEQARAPALRPLPVRPSPTLAALENDEARPRHPEVRIEEHCQSRLPARLDLSPNPDQSRFAKSLARRWEVSVPRSAPGVKPPACSLRGYPTRMNVSGHTADAVEVILSCGPHELRASAPTEPSLRRRHEPLHDVLTAELVRQLADALCD